MPELIAAVEIEARPASAKIYTRSVKGFYQRLRRYTGIPLLAAYFLIPWFSIDGRPTVLFDLTAQKFHIFWLTFWPQDGILLTWLLIMAAFLLFAVTVFVGRVWCGFTCPQTVWSLMFSWAENKCEGDRNQRIKLDKQPWTINKALRRVAKHGIWLVISLATGLTFVGYFYGIQDLVVDVTKLKANAIAVFWVLFFLVCTYINAGWLREKVCQHMCPYARFQSVMYDANTLTVTYDAARGENRGARKNNQDYKKQGLGDCLDCHWCVQVCPVDIDIRDGLQYACIDCGLCIDACNNVMDKVGYQPGLIRFTSESALDTGKKTVFRPLLAGYLTVLVIVTGLFIYGVAGINAIGLDVARERGGQLFYLKNGVIENVYMVKISNKDRDSMRFHLAVDGEKNYQLNSPETITVDKGEVLVLPVRIGLSQSELKNHRERLDIVVHSLDRPELEARQETSFIGPGFVL